MRQCVLEFVGKHVSTLKVHNVVPTAASNPLIGTHSGSFHCDEAMACGLLRHTQDFGVAEVVRTRDEAHLSQCNIVVDVGGKFDSKSLRFDHHQKEFTGTMTTPLNQYKTKMSSAGLVYQHFGRELITAYVKDCVKRGSLTNSLTERELDIVFDRVYRNFVEQVDGIDNGIDEFSPVPADQKDNIQRNYRTSTSLSARVGSLNTRWNETNNAEIENNAFIRAATLAASEFFEAVDFYTCSWLPARTVVEKAFETAETVHAASKGVIVLSEGGCPWKEHLMDIERERGIFGRTLYVIFPDTAGNWRIQSVPTDSSGFENRKSLPWKALRDDALSQASGIEGGIFIHASGFIGGNKTYDGAIAMAIKAVEMTE
jgi:uncharacterized UPF0160 family protein